MAHPMKRQAEDGLNAKMRRMTDGYGSASGPANNKLAPTNREKGEGPQEAVGFGADNSAPRARGDKAARGKPAITNPVPTYKTGGAVARAHGGRTKKGGGKTNVNVIIAPQGAGAGGPPPMPMPPPALAKPPMAPPPPMAKPPMGAGPMGPPPGAAGLPMAPGAPGGLPPGIIPPRKRGGRVHADEAEDKALIEKTLKSEGLVRRARGGQVHHHMTAGAATGEGRLEKIGKKAHNAGRPQAV